MKEEGAATRRNFEFGLEVFVSISEEEDGIVLVVLDEFLARLFEI